MIRRAFLALLLLPACQPAPPPYSNPVTTVYSPTAQAQREAALTGAPVVVEAPQSVATQNLDPVSRPLPQSVVTAVAGPETQADAARAAANSGVVPIDASPSNPAPVQLDNPGISSEQDFGTVSARRSIENDAARIANNRARYTQVAPEALPTRSGESQPNIVQYALQTSHPVGSRVYPRRRSVRAGNCAQFASTDQAQIEFLRSGGPQRDRGGLDPDGDGYACGWDPRPFRKVHAASN